MEDSFSQSNLSADNVGGEPFGAFQNKVLEFFRQRSPSLSEDSFPITRVRDGTWNRNFSSVSDPKETKHIPAVKQNLSDK
ncbi:hypothetical protein MN608_10847 [Microdochium nivale]|nr:hypothetical protein MN608_10847 [Microdochium nivale]